MRNYLKFIAIGILLSLSRIYGQSFGETPVHFQKNMGQWNSSVLYEAGVNGIGVRILQNGSSFYRAIVDENTDSIKVLVWNMTFENSTPTSIVDSGDLDIKYNYFTDANSANWKTDVPAFAKVTYNSLYPNIDLKYYSAERNNLKYDFKLKPGFNINNIVARLDGVNSIAIDASGNLLVNTTWGQLKELKPFSYQIINGSVVPVNITYRIISANKFGYQINGGYNSSYDIILDPLALQLSTFVGNNGTHAYLRAIDVDGSGKIYGIAESPSPSISQSFPLAPGLTGYNSSFGTLAVFRLNAAGSVMERCTFVGSSLDNERATDLKIDASGSKICIVGFANNNTYPTYNPTNTGPTLNNTLESAFLTVFHLNLNALTYSNLFGGSGNDRALALEVVGNNDYLVAGITTSPTFYSATMPNSTADNDAFLIRVNITQPGFTFNKVIGGATNNPDEAVAVALSANQNILVTGTTLSPDFPTLAEPTGLTNSQGRDLFVQRYNLSGTLLNSTVIGSEEEDFGVDIATDASNNIYVLGRMEQSPNSTSSVYPIIGNAYRSNSDNQVDGLLSRINGAFTAIDYSSYYGFGDKSAPKGLALAGINNVIVVGDEAYPEPTGYTGCDFQQTIITPTYADIYISQYDMANNALNSFTYIGGSDNDYESVKPIYLSPNVCVGFTSHSVDLPTTVGAYLTTHPPLQLQSGQLSDAPVITKWQIYNSQTTSIVSAGPDKLHCSPSFTTIGGSPTCVTNLFINPDLGNPGIQYEWSSNPSDPTLTDVANPVVSPTVTTTYTVTVSVNGCVLGTDAVIVTVRNRPVVTITPLGGNNFICSSAGTGTLTATAMLDPAATSVTYIWSGPGIVGVSNQATVNINAAGTYTVIATDNFGCSGSASITISTQPCCPGTVHTGVNGNQPLTFYNVSASQLLTLFSGTTSITTTSKIAINGSLTIDVNFTFLNCPQITFGKDAFVQLNNNTALIVNNSTLKSCDGINMWWGIREDNNTQHVQLTNNAIIMDAAIGIRSNGSARVTLNTGAKVRNCYIGLQMNNNTGGTQFSCQRATFETNPVGTNLLIPPASLGLSLPLTRMFTAIEFNSCSNITLNSTGAAPNENTFSNLECGVFCSSSSIVAANFNYFTNCTNVTSKPRSGYAWYANNSTGTLLAMNIGTGTTYPQNRFVTNANGIFVTGRTFTNIKYNYFQGNTNNCIWVLSNTNSSGINIANNQLYGVSNTGIFWWNNAQSSTSIANNRLESIINGIVLTDNNTGTALTVEQNDIRGGRYGIQATSISSANINYNFAKFSTASYSGQEKVGIFLNGCNGMTVNQNFVDGNNTGSTAPANTRGIVVLTSTNNTIQCDSIIRCEWAMRAVGNSSPTALRSNAMRDCTAGVVLDGQGAQVGGQLWVAAPPFGLSTNDNRWIGNYSAGHTFARLQANANLSTIYVRTALNGTPYNPIPFNALADFQSSNQQPTAWANVPYGLITCQSNYNTNKTNVYLSDNIITSELIAQGLIEYSPDLEPHLEQLDKEILFRQLMDDEDLRAESPVLDSFYLANVSTELGKTIDVRLWASLATDTASADVALSKVNNMSPQNLSEANTKTIQEIYLHTYGRGNTALDSAQLATVESIARQCFVFGGPSVFLARSMYYATKDTVDNSFQDYCLENYGSYKTDESDHSKVDIGLITSLYPNPTDAALGFSLHTNMAGQVRITSMLGQIVKTLESGIGNTYIHTKELSAGVYSLLLVTESGASVSHSFVIR